MPVRRRIEKQRSSNSHLESAGAVLRPYIAQCRIAESEASITIDRDMAGPGSAVTVMFDGDEKDVDTFVLAEHATESSDRTCSTASPLGSALDGSRVRDVRTYSLPSGAESTVTVLGITWP